MKVVSTETISIGDLVPHPRNYQSHPADQLEHIKASLESHGLYRSIVVASDGYILAGHGVVEAAKALGWTEIECKVVDVEHNAPKAIQILIGDNEIGKLAQIDDRELTELLKEIADRDDEIDLLGTGFDKEVLANLLMISRPASEVADHDAAAEWVGMPEFESPPKLYKVLISCDSEKHRQELVDKLDLNIYTTQGKQGTWSARYPKRAFGSLMGAGDWTEAEDEAEAENDG